MTGALARLQARHEEPPLRSPPVDQLLGREAGTAPVNRQGASSPCWAGCLRAPPLLARIPREGLAEGIAFRRVVDDVLEEPRRQALDRSADAAKTSLHDQRCDADHARRGARTTRLRTAGIRELALEHAGGLLGDDTYLTRLKALRDQRDAIVERTAQGLPGHRAVEWLRALGESFQAADVPKEKEELMHAIYERITVAGPRSSVSG